MSCRACAKVEPWSVFACLERGLARRRLPPLAHAGRRVAAADGQWACFTLAVADNRLAEIRFNASPCSTLIACCEALAELNQSARLDVTPIVDTAVLLARLPGIPASKQERAVLAVAAWRAALAASTTMRAV
ncbi:MAG TPA: iron-sulfur cluster assembly scaffold protein [Salinisphaeraceae bacterium]|nr:iron-sulfur cluster assembly scaffold protein [Salinisphaeraceae bacterium]